MGDTGDITFCQAIVIKINSVGLMLEQLPFSVCLILVQLPFFL